MLPPATASDAELQNTVLGDGAYLVVSLSLNLSLSGGHAALSCWGAFSAGSPASRGLGGCAPPAPSGPSLAWPLACPSPASLRGPFPLL